MLRVKQSIEVSLRHNKVRLKSVVLRKVKRKTRTLPG